MEGSGEKKRTRGLLRSRWVWIPAVAAALVLLVLATLPFGVKYGIERTLQSLGAQGVRIEDVDFNPFFGKLSASGVNLRVEGATVSVPHLSLRFRWTPLVSRRVYVDEAEVGGFEIEVTGKVRLPARTADTGWEFGFGKIVLGEGVLNLKTEEFTGSMQVERAEVDELLTWEREEGKASPVVFLGTLDGGRLEFSGEAALLGDLPRLTGSLKVAGLPLKPFESFTKTSLNGEAGLEGKVEATLADTVSVSIEDATATVKDLESEGRGVRVRSGLLEWEGDAKLASRGKFSAVGGLTLAGLELEDASKKTLLEAKTGKVRFKGEASPSDGSSRFSGSMDGTVLSVRLKRAAGVSLIEEFGFEGSVEANLTGDSASISVERAAVTIKNFASQEKGLRIQGERLGWKGRVGLIPPGGPTTLGELNLSGLKIYDASGKTTLLELRTMKSEETGSDGFESISSRRVEARGVAVVRPRAPGAEALFNSGLVAVDGFKLTGFKEIRTGEVILEDASFLLRIKEDGRVYAAGELAKGGVGRDGFILNAALVGVQRGLVRFEDKSVSPPVRLALSVEEAYIKDISSGDVARESAFAFEGVMEKYTALSIAGTAKPFSKRLTLSFTGKIESMDLPPLSPYTVKATGYRLITGQMDARIDARVTEGVIESENELTLRKLDVRPEDQGRLEEFVAELTMPLEVALSLLRDRDDNISFKLPVTGDITSPKFSFSDAMEKAALEAIKKSSLTYLKYYFQPYGAFVTLGQVAFKIGGELARVRLDPVFFAPGNLSLDEEAMKYLEKVSGLMKDRPGIKIKICGMAAGDEGFPEEVLANLARERAESIRDRLVRDHGISPDRLFVCLPEVDRKEGARPRAELLI